VAASTEIKQWAVTLMINTLLLKVLLLQELPFICHSVAHR
jgi:hypothetical protein